MWVPNPPEDHGWALCTPHRRAPEKSALGHQAPVNVLDSPSSHPKEGEGSMKTREEWLLSTCWTPPSVIYKEGEGSRKTMKKRAELKSGLYEFWKVREVFKLPNSQAQGWSQSWRGIMSNRRSRWRAVKSEDSKELYYDLF